MDRAKCKRHLDRDAYLIRLKRAAQRPEECSRCIGRGCVRCEWWGCKSKYRVAA